ncbi:hypothetical protein DSECCO2_609310 [anaerobic digester metagenome]
MTRYSPGPGIATIPENEPDASVSTYSGSWVKFPGPWTEIPIEALFLPGAVPATVRFAVSDWADGEVTVTSPERSTRVTGRAVTEADP